MKPKILITDDEKPTRDVMARILSAKYECLTAPDAEQALKIISSTPDLALLITDYKMPGDNGITLIKNAKKLNHSLACIIITAFGEIDLAVEAMQEGADDFLTKPITDINSLEMRVAKAIARHDLEREISEEAKDASPITGHEARGTKHETPGAFIGNSPAMQHVYRLIEKVAPTNSNIYIEGPSGAGKELVARAIHQLSTRSKGPFIAVECSALPATLLETELFGSIRGAFTDARDRIGCFESADGGTLFLDEIGEIDANVQVKLLRVLETHTFQRVGETVDRHSDFRLVTATNRNLLKAVAEGTFREDLYYRLNVIDIRLPALKDRPGDVALLVDRFMHEFSAQYSGVVKCISPEALKILEEYSWPGNVRQLRNVIEKMVVLASGEELAISDIPPEIRASCLVPRASDAETAKAAKPSNSQTIQAEERILVENALRDTKGNITKAAELLGISRRTLHRRINDWGLK